MDEQKIKEIFSDEEFVKSLLALETPEEVQAALEEKDIDLTVDEIKQIRDLLVKKQNGELTAEDLENVTGGFCFTAIGLAVFTILSVVTVFAGPFIADATGW